MIFIDDPGSSCFLLDVFLALTMVVFTPRALIPSGLLGISDLLLVLLFSFPGFLSRFPFFFIWPYGPPDLVSEVEDRAAKGTPKLG